MARNNNKRNFEDNVVTNDTTITKEVIEETAIEEHVKKVEVVEKKKEEKKPVEKEVVVESVSKFKLVNNKNLKATKPLHRKRVIK